MSAIAGILWFDGAPAQAGELEKLTRIMACAGPDAQTHWIGGSVALGHCMLRTTPESLQEVQPLVSPDGRSVLVWDGRLDNREQLQGELAALGAALRDDSDAELALQSYLAWGQDCPKHFLGDFAFVVWDVGLQELFCARDHMGARPFFWTQTDDFFAFASHDEALLELPGVSCAPSEKHVAHMLVPQYTGFDTSHSWVKSIKTLFAAHTVTVMPDRASKTHEYWRLTAGEENHYESDEQCQQAFLEVFGQAVSCRMRSLGDCAAMMSGGMDSASISAMVDRLLPDMPGKRFHTYSAISDDVESCVESQCILSLTQKRGENAHFVSVPSFTGMLNVEDLLSVGWSSPHPIDNSILLPAMMCLAAQRNGHRVLLHGVCGDLTTYAPYHLYVASLLRAGHGWQAWQSCRDACRNNTYFQGATPFVTFCKSVLWALPLRSIRRLLGWRRRRQLSPTQASLISPAFAREQGLDDWFKAHASQQTLLSSDIQSLHLQILRPPHGLASSMGGYTRVANRYGIELRDPWADRRVVEFWVRLPWEFKLRFGWGKYLVRSTFRADLAPEVLWRKGKEHVGWNFFYRLMDESRSLIERIVGGGLTPIERYVGLQLVRERYAEYLKTKEHFERESIYDILTLAFWLERMKKVRSVSRSTRR